MLAWLRDRLFGASTEGEVEEEDIRKATDILVAETDTRLRLVGGYRRKLRKPVIRSLQYVAGLVDCIPGPFEVNRRSYGSDPQVSALFGSVDDIAELAGQSRTLEEFFRDNPRMNVAYAALAMTRTEKKVFGVEMSGDIVKRDVAQVAVSFSGHRIGVCAPSELAIRQQLKWRGIHTLALTALQNITRLKQETGELGRERELLKMKLRDLAAQHRGLDSLAGQCDEGEAGNIARHLEETGQQLANARARLGTLDDYLAQVLEVAGNPSRYLRVSPGSVWLNRMNIRVDSGDAGRGSEIISANVRIGNRPPIEGVIAVFRRDQAA